MSKASDNRALAYLYAVMTYRNDTSLENRHWSQQPLDEEFFQTMRNEVSTLFESRHRVFTENLNGVPPKTEEEQKVIAYVGICLYSIHTWFPPEKVRDRFKGDVASFVLDGRFKQACEAHEVPTDELMKEMNHDVHCRYYTLLCRGII